MAYRSQSKRQLRPSLSAMRGALLLPLLVAGCQSNAQQDLIARELRMQEDQIYAMEDYLAEYQQLICKYRMENAALRRQLGEEDDATLPPRRRTPRERNGTAPTMNGPAIEAPPPRPNGTRPQQGPEPPEVPPLQETTTSDTDGEAALAAGELTVDATSITPAAAVEPSAYEQSIDHVWLHGEVVENDAGGGPRLVVEVEPLDADGQTTEFAGRLSLMLLAPDGNGAPQNLARWDFAPEEVRSAIDAAANDRIIRFHLELPADTPIVDATQIWVRLLPPGGEKLLAHAAIDLDKLGQFSSRPTPPEERQMIVAAHDNRPSDHQPAVPAELHDAGWTIARPGEPANLPDATEESTGGWRESTEPMPIAVARSVPARPRPRLNRPPRHAEPPKSAAADAPKRTGWSPDRPHDSSDGARLAKSPARPRWSATR